MSGRVRQVGELARKRLVTATVAQGMRIAERSNRLAAAGVPTPPASYDAHAGELVMPWIAGLDGRMLLAPAPATRSAKSGSGMDAACLVRILDPLVRLHGARPGVLDLPTHDPWRRIRPRLRTASGQDRLLARARRLAQELRARATRLPRFHRQLVHGDFHIGQLVLETATAKTWIVDLDDLALGPAESDLGNFAAHLVSSASRAGRMDRVFAALAAALARHYSAATGIMLGDDLISFYGAVALLRRALKWRERGESGYAAVVLATAERVATRIPASGAPPQYPTNAGQSYPMALTDHLVSSGEL